MSDDHSATVPATLAPESADDGGLSIEAVAAAQGISKDAARRRLRSGKLAGHQRPSRYGQVWCIHLDGQIPESPRLRQSSATVAEEDRQGSASVAGDEHHSGVTVAPTSAQPADVAALVGIIDRLTVENGELRTEANGWKSQALMFALQLNDAQQQLAIAAPAETPVVPQPEPVPAPAPVESPVPVWRRWWPLAFVLAGLVAVALMLGWPR